MNNSNDKAINYNKIIVLPSSDNHIKRGTHVDDSSVLCKIRNNKHYQGTVEYICHRKNEQALLNTTRTLIVFSVQEKFKIVRIEIR